MELHIPDMSCNHCVQTITRTVQEIDPSATVVCDLASHTARIDTKAEPAEILARLEEAGYPATAATAATPATAGTHTA